jgi:carbon starvation protein
VNSVLALGLAVVAALVGYYIYARYVDEKIVKVDPKKATPAKMYMDGVDFMPTGRHVLFGYQFKSIAALGPVTGPIAAMQWGWLPGLLWIVFGTLLIGWVQDYVSAIVGLRNDGQSFGALAYRLISPRGRLTLLSFIYFYLILIVAAFSDMTAAMMAKLPSVPLAIIGLMAVGILAGWMIYKKKVDIMVTTVIMVVLALFSIWLGSVLAIPASKLVWVLFTLLFSYLGAVLPIWSYTQPINYISFYLVALGMLGAVLGILVGHPSFTTPSFTTYTIGVGPMWPILFVTIACGAISGWHSLVSSSGTARQLESEADAKYVAGGSMYLEMILATIALIIAGAAFANFDAYKTALKAGPATVFSVGMAKFFGFIGIPEAFGTAFAGAMFCILAITVMQLVVRFARIATAELVGDAVPAFRNQHVGAVVTLAIVFGLVYTNTWSYIWTLFGGSNQLMASLALLMATIWLASQKKSHAFTLWPALFMFITTIFALGLTARNLILNVGKLQAGTLKPATGQSIGLAMGGNIVAAAIGIFLMVAALILIYDGLKMYFKIRGETRAPKAPVAQATPGDD